MNSYPHKNNLICLSEIKDWYNLVPDYRNNTISVDERYFQSVRPGYQIDIKKLHCILKTNFYHYYILIDFSLSILYLWIYFFLIMEVSTIIIYFTLFTQIK